MHISKFLYNRDCSAETNVFVDINEAPCLDWKISLPSNPSYAVETMAVWDKKGNLYLGCHNGNFYSICVNGSIRFSFQTNFKIFSTPLVFDDYVFFCSGDGFVYCLSCEGKLLWKKEVSNSKLVDHKKSIFEKTCSKLNFKVPKKSIGTIRTWASLNIDFLNRLFITTAEEGLVVLSIEGHILKKIPLKFKYPLAGVVFFNDGSFVLPDQKCFLYCFDKNFNKLWEINIGNFDIWSNPVVDNANKYIYVAGTKRNSSIVCCFNQNGNLKWKRKFNSELRGGISLNKKTGLIVPLFNGDLFLLNKKSGTEIFNLCVHKGDRVLWTTPTTDSNGNIFVSVRTTRADGKVVFVNSMGKICQTIKTGKILSPPSIDNNLNIFFGDWNGNYYKYKLKKNE